MSRPKILVVGSLNMDLTTRTPRMPSAGETLTANSFSTGCGGKGANQAVACARASRTLTRSSDPSITESEYASITVGVAMIGAVGSDHYGEQLRCELKLNGIDITGIEVLEGQVSGVAVILVEEGSGENRILVTPGANANMNPMEFEAMKLPLPDLLVLQLEIPLEKVLSVMRAAKKLGVEVLLNPSPPLDIPDADLKGLSHLIMNETEAQSMLGVLYSSKWSEEEKLEYIFKFFERLGVLRTVVTLGARGVCYSKGKGGYERIQSHKVDEVVDTTGAGDTFVGYYAVEVAKWKKSRSSEPFDIGMAVHKANKAAAKAVEKRGSLESIPWNED